MKSEKSVTIPNNIPLRPTSFVNMVSEIEETKRRLADPHISIIAISGPAGIGKTVLSAEVARQQVESGRFPGGVVWLDCSNLTSLPQILRTITEVVGLESEFSAPSTVREMVSHHLRSTPTFLIFDNYDTVSEDDEVLSFVVRLPRPTKALISARKTPRIPEFGFGIRLEPFSAKTAFQLWAKFLGDKRWAKEDEEALQEIHLLIGGLPLAAALIGGLLERGWSTHEILEQLREGAIPAGGIIEYILEPLGATLPEKQRKLLEALSVFEHPANGAAMAEVAEMEDWRQSVEALSRISVVEVLDGRYALHPLVKAYFRGRVAPKQLEALEKRMAQHYLQYIGNFQNDFDQVDQEWQNIQYAVETTYRNRLWQLLIEFVLSLGQFLSARGYVNEYQRWLGQALEATEKTGDVSTRAVLLHNLAVQFQQRGDLDSALGLYEQSLALEKATIDLDAESATLTNIGTIYRSRGDFKGAIGYYEQALLISRQTSDRLGEANILGSLGVIYADLGEYHQANAFYEQALVISREMGHRRGEANALGNLGTSYAGLGEYLPAIAYYKQALMISRDVGDRRGENTYLRNMGAAYQDLFSRTGSAENLDVAIQFFQQALLISQEMGDRRTEANLYANLEPACGEQC